MGISSITSTNSMSAMQMTAPNLKDQKSKNIQSDITNAQQQMKKLSSKEDLSANEKTNERKKLQKEISSLNIELKQYQEELRKSQKREIMMAELQEDTKPAQEEKPEEKMQSEAASPDSADKKSLPADEKQTAQPGTVITQNNDGSVILKDAVSQSKNQSQIHNVDTGNKPVDETKEKSVDVKEEKATDNDTDTDSNLSAQKMQAMVSADSSLQQASNLGTIVAKTRNGIAILKGEINQDENRGVDTERKQAELEKMEKQEQRAMTYQFSILGEANNTMKAATETNASVKDSVPDKAENTLYISGLNMPQDEQELQQRFFVSFG